MKALWLAKDRDPDNIPALGYASVPVLRELSSAQGRPEEHPDHGS
jgi:hypothetical protein